MRLNRIWYSLIGAATLLAACKDAPSKPAAARSSDPTGAADSDRAAPERHVGPSGGRMRPPRQVPRDTPDPGALPGEGEGADVGGDPAAESAEDARAERRRERGDRGDRPSRQDRIAEFDGDGDGKLDPAERDVMRKARVGDQLARMDQDGDGLLAPGELEGSKRFAALDFAAADADHDGMLSQDELGTALTQRREQRKGERRRLRFRDGAGDGGDAGVR